MSLLLLFNPSPAIPVNTQTLSPMAMYSVEMATPQLKTVNTTTPSMDYSYITAPVVLSAQKVEGEFSESSVQYSSSTVTYSSSTEIYGGADVTRVKLVTLSSIDEATPKVYSIEKI